MAMNMPNQMTGSPSFPPQEPTAIPQEPMGQPAPPIQMAQQPQQPGTAAGPSDIPHVLQFNLQITMIALLKQMQNVMTSQSNMFEKMKSIPLLAQAVSSMHTAFHNTESLEFDKSKPDNAEVDAQIAKQNADHQYALDLMAQNHDEQLNEQKMQLEQQKAEHQMKLAEMKAEVEMAKAQQEQSHKDELHQETLEKEQIAKAQTIQQAQHTEEKHTQTMSIAEKQSEADLKASKDAGSKPEA